MSKNKIEKIYEAVGKTNRPYEIWAGIHGLTVYELRIYYVILQKEKMDITQTELCKELDAPKTSINSIVKKQLKAGYIGMNINPKNKREKMLFLTETGKVFARNLVEPLFRYEEEAAALLDDREVEAAVASLNKFAEILLEKVDGKNV